MKTGSQIFKTAKVALRTFLLLLFVMQLTSITAYASQQVSFRWGATSSFDGGGADSVKYAGNTSITNNQTITFNDNTHVTVTITPTTGYVVNNVEYKSSSSSLPGAFTPGTGSGYYTVTNNQFTFDVGSSRDRTIQITLEQAAPKNVYVRWGTTSSWNGDGGTVTSTGNTVSNKGNTSFAGTATPVFILTPNSGYIVSRAEWRDNDSDGFTTGDGTDLTVTNNEVTFQMTNRNCSLQVTFAPVPTKNIYVRWGTDSNWNGDGGSVTATGYTVTNKGNTAYPSTGTATFTITPTSGYVISSVKWRDNDSDGFDQTSSGTTLTPNSSNQVSFTLTDRNCSFQVLFQRDTSLASSRFTSYYGTTNTTDFNTAAANWEGGTVYRIRTSTGALSALGGTSNATYDYGNNTDRDFRIIPNSNYKIISVKYIKATWSDASNITPVGSTWTSITSGTDSNGSVINLPESGSTFNFNISGLTSPDCYVIWVVFERIGAAGGSIGAWYGTNNITAYDAPSPTGPDGSGGTVWKTSPGSAQQFTNKTPNNITVSSDGTVVVEVRPASNFKITSIMWGATSPTNSVSVPANQTSNMSFNMTVSGGNSYIVWVVFTSTAAGSFTVTGSVDPASEASCLLADQTTMITPNPQVVNVNSTGSFSLSTATTCMIESINFCSASTCSGAQAWVGSGSTYSSSSTPAMPPVVATSTFTAKFRTVGFNILAEVDSTSASGCGTISPVGTANYPRGSTQTFVITTNSGCAVSHVWVTDTNKGYTTDTDIAPLATSAYTFVNLQAYGHIKVKFSTVVPTAGDSYCQIPPFVSGQSSLAPNVLIIFDNSGSMGGSSGDAYYNRKTYDCTSSSTLTSCANFYGYFDPGKMYKLSGTSGTDANSGLSKTNTYIIDNVTLNLSSTNGLSGNYLNYRHMDKVDVLRKALMGGKIISRTATTKYLHSNNGKAIEYGTTLPSGIVQQLSGRVRFGLMVFNDPAEGGHLAKIPDGSGGWKTDRAVLGSSEADLVAALESSETDPGGSTPIAETLYEAVRYYQAKPSAYNSGVDYGTMADPIQNSCQKHFVLLLTDGEPNNNNNLPGLGTYPTMNGYTDSVFDVTTWQGRIPANDRADNNNSTCFTSTYQCMDSHGALSACSTNTEKVEAVSFYAHNTDLRASAYNNDIEGIQNLTIFPVYAFGNGTGTKTLHMTAKYGGYENKNANAPSPNTWPSPDQQSEWDHLSDPTKYDCTPYNYFEGDDGAALEGSILTAMSTILAKVASGTAASILSNSEGSGANLLQAVFYPNKIFSMPASGGNPDKTAEISWIGEMQNLWYYVDPFIANSTVREDSDYTTTTPNRILNLKSDYAARFYFTNSETKVELKQDTNGDGLGDIVISSTLDPDDVKSIWRAGKQLWARTPSSRTIHTSVDGYSLLLPANTGGGFYAAATRATALQPFLQAADNDSNAEAMKIINYIRGTDQTSYRNRKVSINYGGSTLTNEWKLGDIVSSTPRIQSTGKLNSYNLDSPVGYGDTSYAKFVSSSNYAKRGMVYVGANDGMLHAFKLGKLTVSGTSDAIIPSTSTHYTITGDVKATLTGTDLGEEQWAYIPRNALPYLKYFTDSQNYKHLFYVDGPTILSDVAVGKPSGCGDTTDYSECLKDNTSGTNWRTILIGSMGLGGASKLKDPSACSDVAAAAGTCCKEGMDGTCVKTPIYKPVSTDGVSHLTYASPPAYDTTKGVGYSSYFAMDITDQYFNSDGTLANQPTLKWEFPPRDDATNSFGLGYATSGPAIVRISAKKNGFALDGTTVIPVNDKTKNGKWFAVFASGPTGPIDTVNHRFMGRSDQNLKFFVVDLGASAPLVLNTSYWVIDTGIQRAFAGSIVNSAIDTDRWNSGGDGNYQDDALYVGYTKASIADSSPITNATTWNDGGVVRLLTKEDPNPANWVASPVISGIGPVTSGIAKLQDRKNKKLWLYFGTGRFFFGGDDVDSQRYIMGVQDGCYTSNNTFDKRELHGAQINCDTSTKAGDNPVSTGKGGVLALSDLSPQTTIDATTLAGKKGWYINLDGQDAPASLSAERAITDAVALTSGMVCYTTFKPTSDVCKFGGNSYPWCVKYDSGGLVGGASLTGKILIQVSTGAFEEIDLRSALTTSVGGDGGGRKGAVMTGKPPSDPPPIVTNAANKPTRKILHILEK